MTTHAEARSLHAALLDGQRRVLERIASGAPLAESLGTIATLVEQHAEGVRCSVLLVDQTGERLTIMAGPSLPASYMKEVEACLRIGPDMGSCAAAAYLRKPVYTQDTVTDPRWEKYRDVAVRNGVRAVWSTPILADDNSVLGIFSMSCGEPGLPSPEHIRLIDMAVQMARVAIEAKRDEAALRRNHELFLAEAERIGALSRNQELFLAEAQRLGALLGVSGSADGVEPVKSDGPPIGAESPAAVRRKLEAERKAIASLTEKERAIFALITAGKSNAEVAGTLHLSPRTVETYRGRLMEKLQVEDLVGLVKFAIRHGITGVD
jgi:DNA-binding NarL/FixJ family response regulator